MKNIPKKTKKAIDRIRINPLKKKPKKVKSETLSGLVLDDLQGLDVLSDDEDTADDDAVIMNKNKNNPWFNEDIASIVKLCRKYRRKHHKSKTKKNELKQICKELEKKKRKLIRAAKQKWLGRNNGNNVNMEKKVTLNTNIIDLNNIDPPTPPLLTPEPPNHDNIDNVHNATGPVYEVMGNGLIVGVDI